MKREDAKSASLLSSSSSSSGWWWRWFPFGTPQQRRQQQCRYVWMDCERASGMQRVHVLTQLAFCTAPTRDNNNTRDDAVKIWFSARWLPPLLNEETRETAFTSAKLTNAFLYDKENENLTPPSIWEAFGRHLGSIWGKCDICVYGILVRILCIKPRKLKQF